MYKIRLGIIDDDPDWISAMRLYLGNEEDMEITAAATNRAEAEKITSSGSVDIVLMDIRLADEHSDGVSLTAELLLKFPVKIIMLTSSVEDAHILDSFAAGAVNYVNKTNYKDIPMAVRSAYGGGSPSDILLRDYVRLRENEMLSSLTPTEKEIISLLNEGYTHSQIQKRLYKTESTLKNQINSILKKLEVKNVKEAIRKIKTKGIIK